MRKRTILLIDAENISHRRTDKIFSTARKQGALIEQKVYHLRKDPSTRKWSEKSNKIGYKDVCLDGAPQKNKVDQKIQKDARHYMRSPKYDKVCIVTSDGGYCCLTQESKAKEKLCFIGEKKAPDKLRKAGVCFIELI